MDFVQDQLATGRKLRMLMTVDTFSHFSPAIKPRFTAALTLRGYSKKSAGKSDHRVDQGTEWDDRHLSNLLCSALLCCLIVAIYSARGSRIGTKQRRSTESGSKANERVILD